MKLIEYKERNNWLSKLRQIKKAFNELKKQDRDFKWSWFDFLYKVYILGSHDLLFNTTIKEHIEYYVFILIIAKNRQFNHITIEYYYISPLFINDSTIISSLRVRIVQYRIQLYSVCILTLKPYQEKIKSLFENYLDFHLNNKVKLINRFKENKGETIIKYLM